MDKGIMLKPRNKICEMVLKWKLFGCRVILLTLEIVSTDLLKSHESFPYNLHVDFVLYHKTSQWFNATVDL